MTITYVCGSSLYINLTNRCSNRCAFCVRDKHDDVNGEDNLWLDREPTEEEIKADISKRTLLDYDSVVFCGFGEPFERYETVFSVAKWIKEKYGNFPIRVNTNGQGNLIAGRDITSEMKGIIDTVSISLNTDTAEKYDKLCKSRYGIGAYDAILKFAKESAKYVREVVLSVVDRVLSPDEIETCRKIAKECGVSFRVREYIE